MNLPFVQAKPVDRSSNFAKSASDTLPEPVQAAALQEPSVRLLYERGATLAALGETDAALSSLRAAGAKDPGLAAIWHRLAAVSQSDDDRRIASRALSILSHSDVSTVPWAAHTKKLPSVKLEQAIRKTEAGYKGTSPETAEFLLREHLHAEPEDVAAMRVLAGYWIDQIRYPEAEALLGRILELAPSFADARFMLAVVMFRQGHAALAVPHAETALTADRKSIPVRTLLASCLAMSGEFSRAIALYEGIIADSPKLAPVWLSYGNALKSAGRADDALRAYRRCIALAPGLGEAYWSIANFKTARFSDADLTGMRNALEGGKLSVEDRFHLHYSLGRALEQDRDFEGSFTHYAEGARIRRTLAAYSADATSAMARRHRALFTAAFFDTHAGGGCMDADPILVLGLPRAGSTLIEQILSSHSQVEGTMELPEIIAMANKLGGSDGRQYPECLAQHDAAQLAELGAGYMRDTRAYRTTRKPFFIDKMPGNWEHVGLIRLILPNAKIIDARRDPMANCFAAFKQLFSALDYSYDLTDLGRYYRDYAGMMAHWDEVQPGAVHRVVYEDLVADTETQVRSLLAYCGLDFEPACLRFWETQRAVSTASSEQVRQPIFREGLDQWRNYEPWLGPLKEALEG